MTYPFYVRVLYEKSCFFIILVIVVFIQLGVILKLVYNFDLSQKVETETVDDMISNTERQLSDLYFLKAKKLFVHRITSS